MTSVTTRLVLFILMTISPQSRCTGRRHVVQPGLRTETEDEIALERERLPYQARSLRADKRRVISKNYIDRLNSREQQVKHVYFLQWGFRMV